MAIRKAEAVWQGTLKEGAGTMSLGSGAYEGAYTYASRFEEAPGSNPEELVGAALAGCFSMFLAAQLTNAGYPPIRIHTSATVHLGRDDSGPKITKIELDTEAQVGEIDAEEFLHVAQVSKNGCPVSRALAGTDIELQAKLERQ
ncbi:MAG: OsmC family protein [Candidatus Promineifilaceae bacterium]